MADTAHLDELTEHRDDAVSIQAKVKQLADLIRASQHAVVFTGAGISTSADIPDFRGPNGVWTCEAQGRALPEGVEMTAAVPTPCHMVLREMLRVGQLKYVISQNVDGLHRRSGVPSECLSELHGNLYLEVCWAKGCTREYSRTFDVSARINGVDCEECRQRVPHFCHCTGRACDCGAMLKDSIIHFQENLPEAALRDSFEHSGKADLMIVLGSSLRVSPACEMPRSVKQHGGKLVVVNLQTTPCDSICDLRINGETDDVMIALAAELGVSVPQFDLGHFCSETVEEASMRLATSEPPTVGSAMFDPGSWHAVEPLDSCPHTCSVGKDCTDLTIDLEAPCACCGHIGENMICLQCNTVHCGRHVQGHAVTHGEQTGHPLIAGFADLSFWCYQCDSYIRHTVPGLAPVYSALHIAKFDEAPPGM